MEKWLESHGIFVIIIAQIISHDVKAVINYELSRWQPQTTSATVTDSMLIGCGVA